MRLPSLRTSLIITGAVLALGVSGGIATLIARPAPQKRTVTETKTHTESQELVEAQRQRDEYARANYALHVQLQASEKRQADVNTRVVERIERYPQPIQIPAPAAAPATSPAPAVVVVRDGSDGGLPSPPAPVPVSVPPQPLEIIVRTTETVDRSRTETDTRSEATAKGEGETTRTDVEETRRTATSKTDTETRTETETKPAGAERSGPRFGVGITSATQPFTSYDLAQMQLGPKAFGLGKVAAGLFLTRSQAFGVDGGPQVNVQPGKGRLFIMGGYQIREKTPILGVGFKF